MTQKATDPKTIGIEKQLARVSGANRAAATRYVAIRRLHGLREGSVYNYASVLRKLDAELDPDFGSYTRCLTRLSGQPKTEPRRKRLARSAFDSSAPAGIWPHRGSGSEHDPAWRQR